LSNMSEFKEQALYHPRLCHKSIILLAISFVLCIHFATCWAGLSSKKEHVRKLI